MYINIISVDHICPQPRACCFPQTQSWLNFFSLDARKVNNDGSRLLLFLDSSEIDKSEPLFPDVVFFRDPRLKKAVPSGSVLEVVLLCLTVLTSSDLNNIV